MKTYRAEHAKSKYGFHFLFSGNIETIFDGSSALSMNVFLR